MSLDALQAALNRTLPDARIEVMTLPDCGAIRLGLINADYQTGPLAPKVMHAVIRDPAYWAFCWGSGLALARFLLEEPHRVQDRTVVDLGSGCGIAGIAAALAGGRRVIACDTDPDARLATRTNAGLNQADVETTHTLPGQCDLLLMADVLYDRQNLPLLDTVQTHAREILVADTRIHSLPNPGFREIACRSTLTLPNPGEFDEFRHAHIFRCPSAPAG